MIVGASNLRLTEARTGFVDSEPCVEPESGELSRSGAGRKLLFVVNQFEYFRSHRLPLAQAAADAGYEVHVATPDGPDTVQEAYSDQIRWHRYPLERSSLGLFRELRSVAALVRLYRRLRPDLVHHVTVKPVLYGTLAAFACHVPAVVNAVPGIGGSYATRWWRSWLVHRAMSVGYRLASLHPRTRFVFQNQDDQQSFIGLGWVRSNQVELIGGAGVDLELFSPAPSPRAEVSVILHARMLWSKGVGVFVEAARLLRDCNVRFLLAGQPDPGSRDSVSTRQLEEWHREGVVEYLGRRDDIPDLLRQSSIACLPSFYGEGVPKSLIEAAAAGLAIVTTDVRGCRDVVDAGTNGLLVRERDPAALANALRTLIDSPEVRQRMGRASRRRAEEEFGLESVKGRTLHIYDEMLGISRG